MLAIKAPCSQLMEVMRHTNVRERTWWSDEGRSGTSRPSSGTSA